MATVSLAALAGNWNPPDVLPIDDGTPPPFDGGLPLCEALEAQAAEMRSRGTLLGDWLALVIDEKASFARRHQANTLEELDERTADEELSHEQRLWDKAHAAGYDACVAEHFLESCYQHGEPRRYPELPEAAQVALAGHAPWTPELAAANERFSARVFRKPGGRKPLD